jgi:hypothetical protein
MANKCCHKIAVVAEKGGRERERERGVAENQGVDLL